MCKVIIQTNNYPLKPGKLITVKDIDGNPYKLHYDVFLFFNISGKRIYVDLYAIKSRIVFTIGHNNINAESIITFILNNPQYYNRFGKHPDSLITTITDDFIKDLLKDRSPKDYLIFKL